MNETVIVVCALCQGGHARRELSLDFPALVHDGHLVQPGPQLAVLRPGARGRQRRFGRGVLEWDFSAGGGWGVGSIVAVAVLNLNA